jgi:DNA-binding transcriptional MerR regulator
LINLFKKYKPSTLRNWELNGLMAIKRRENGYRIYTEEDLMRLKIIRSLRCANYSLTEKTDVVLSSSGKS